VNCFEVGLKLLAAKPDFLGIYYAGFDVVLSLTLMDGLSHLEGAQM